MSHDLDSALRDSLRRHAESAPTVIDTDGIRVLAKKIQRRRTLESVAAAFVLLGVVIGLGAVIGSLRTDATPPPVTSGTATPTPTGSAPTTYSDLPWVASVIPYTNPGAANATQPSGGNKLVVTVAGKQTVVTDVGNAALTLVGWYGAGHQSLVYIAGQDVVNDLHRATFAEDGSVESDEVLTIDGSSKGVATPLTTGGFAWVPSRPGTFPGKDEIVDYVDDSFQVVASRPAPAGAWLVTREVVVSRDGGTLTITGDAASTTRKLPASCIDAPAPGPDGHGTTAVSPDGRVAALECGAHVVLVSLDPSSPSSVDELPAVPGGGSVIAAWFDPQSGLSASSSDDPRQTTSTSARTSVWNATTLRWDTAYQQNVVMQVWSGDTAFSLYADKPGEDPDVQPPAWFSETTPHLQVSPTNATLESYGLTFAARTPVTTPSVSPTTSNATSALGWVATTRSYDKAGHAPLTDVVVTIGSRQVVATTVENAIARPLGWYGPDHLTLVWEEGNGDPGLQAVTFRSDGTLADRPHALALPGVTPSANSDGTIFGSTVAVPGGGFVIWSERTGAGESNEYLRVDDALQLVSRTPAGDEGSVLAAGRDAFVTVVGNTLTTAKVAVHTSDAVTQVALPTPCEGLEGGPMSPDGTLAPLSCAAPSDGSTATARVLDVAALRFTGSQLKAPGAAILWWDGSDLHASTSTASSWTTWLLTGSRWSAAPDGTPVQQVTSGGATFVTKTDGGWYAESAPDSPIDSDDPPVARPTG